MSTKSKEARPRNHATEYQRRKEAALADPKLAEVDLVILAELPPEGSRLGYHTVAATVTGIRNKLRRVDKSVTSDMVSGRLRSMESLLLCTNVVLPQGDVLGWQVTPAGAEYVKKNQKLLRELRNIRPGQNGSTPTEETA